MQWVMIECQECKEKFEVFYHYNSRIHRKKYCARCLAIRSNRNKKLKNESNILSKSK